MDMNMETNQDNNVKKIVSLIKEMEFDDTLKDALNDFHDNDIADALEYLSVDERKLLYQAIGPERTGEVFSYLKDDVNKYIAEINITQAAKIVEEMDTDDAVELLEQIDDTIEEKILEKMDDKVEEEIRLIQSYDEDELGSLMTTNFIKLNILYTVKQAMRELIRQSEDNDNIDTLYVVDSNGLFCGVVDLRDLIKARESDKFNELVIALNFNTPFILKFDPDEPDEDHDHHHDHEHHHGCGCEHHD